MADELIFGGAQKVFMDTTGKVAGVAHDVISTVGQAYTDTQANVTMVANNAVTTAGNVAGDAQRNLFTTAIDTEARITAVADSFLDNVTDIGHNVVSDIGTIIVLMMVMTFGIGILYSDDFVSIFNKIIDKVFTL